MSSKLPPAPGLPAPLAQRLPDDASAAQIAAAAAAIWRELDAVLTPLVGVRGVAALGQRSLHLASADHPWLAAGQPRGPVVFDPTLLWPLLAARRRDEAAAAGGGFLSMFRSLLSSLIGAGLTERLLREVWTPAAPSATTDPFAQDPMP